MRWTGRERGSQDSRRARADPDWEARFERADFERHRLLAELVGTFLLVTAAAGAPVVDAVSGGEVGGPAAAVAPGLMVTSAILALGEISGAHLNPIVTLAFAGRSYFPWRRVPGYVLAQLAGATLACYVLAALFGSAGDLGVTRPGPMVSTLQALAVESVLSFGLVTVVLGTAAGARNVGALSALAVGGYVALAGLWASPVSGASMNPARSLAPAIVLGDMADAWLYVVGPLIGAAFAVVVGALLRGHRGEEEAKKAAQGDEAP